VLFGMLTVLFAVVLGWGLDVVVLESVVLVFRGVGRVGDWTEVGGFSFEVVASDFVEVFGGLGPGGGRLVAFFILLFVDVLIFVVWPRDNVSYRRVSGELGP
jgi:hypothetical protein